MNNLKITPCTKAPEYKPGHLVTVTSRQNPNKPDTYLVLRPNQDNKGVIALPVSGKETELHPSTIAASNYTKSVQTTGVLNYVA